MAVCVCAPCVCVQVRATIPLMILEELLDEDVQVICFDAHLSLLDAVLHTHGTCPKL